jgi:hypothetical protein
LLGAGIPVERTGERFQEEVLSFADPDGMRLEIVGHADAGEAKGPAHQRHFARARDPWLLRGDAL